jgi:hypothetical protein
MGKVLKPRMVVVSWVDAQDLPEHWVRFGEHDQEPAVVESVGFLIQPDPLKDHVTLACSWHDGVYASGINIPRVCVRKIRRLK